VIRFQFRVTSLRKYHQGGGEILRDVQALRLVFCEKKYCSDVMRVMVRHFFRDNDCRRQKTGRTRSGMVNNIGKTPAMQRPGGLPESVHPVSIFFMIQS
jgi:hypothetical protein